MICKSCSNPISDGSKFCPQCGAPVPQKRLCPGCGAQAADNAVFCNQCGIRLGAAPQQTQVNPVQNHQTHSPLQSSSKYYMISKYVGEPTVGIAKATGTLSVFPDRLEFSKLLGNALGGIGSLPMAVAASKARQDGGKVESYYYQDVQNAYVGRYAAVMPTVVLILNDGQVFSFAGSFTSQSAQSVVNTVLSGKQSG